MGSVCERLQASFSVLTCKVDTSAGPAFFPLIIKVPFHTFLLWKVELIKYVSLNSACSGLFGIVLVRQIYTHSFWLQFQMFGKFAVSLLLLHTVQMLEASVTTEIFVHVYHHVLLINQLYIPFPHLCYSCGVGFFLFSEKYFSLFSKRKMTDFF